MDTVGLIFLIIFVSIALCCIGCCICNKRVSQHTICNCFTDDNKVSPV